MKKLLMLLLVLFVFLSLVSCGKKEDTVKEDDKQQETSDKKDETKKDDKKEDEVTLVLDGSKLGSLQVIDKQDDYVINGHYIASLSGQHKYEHVDDVETFSNDGLNSEFELNERISFYIDINSDSLVDIYIVRNDDKVDYTKVSKKDLESICVEKDYPMIVDAKADVDNKGYICEVYIHPETSDPDLFNVFICANNKVCYVVQLDIIAENTTEQ